jgi:hypothetical protein
LGFGIVTIWRVYVRRSVGVVVEDEKQPMVEAFTLIQCRLFVGINGLAFVS